MQKVLNPNASPNLIHKYIFWLFNTFESNILDEDKFMGMILEWYTYEISLRLQ